MKNVELLREELEGHIRLRHEDHAIRLTKRLLASKRITAKGLCSAINALLICVDNLHRWEHRVEMAFDRLDVKQKQLVRPQMFSFFVSIERWDDAERFMPKNPQTPSEFLFGVWTHLSLHRVAEAERLVKRCWRRFKYAGEELEQSCLTEAMACFLAQSRKWDEAQEFWEIGSSLWPFATHAWDGLIKLHALRGHHKANEVFSHLQEAKSCCHLAGTKACLPKECIDELNRQFHLKALHLAKVIPAKERWRFGL